MEHYLTIENKKITCVFRKLKRSRRIRLTVQRNGRVLVTLPRLVPIMVAKQFLLSHKDWIAVQLARLHAVAQTKWPSYHQVKARAKSAIAARVKHFNITYGFIYQKITIKQQTSRWGSCSSKGNLNFNYRLLFLDSTLLDYVVVHELCHLEQHNHSRQFWQLVSRAMPNFQACRRALRAVYI
jgi:hypothetical protein